MTKYAVFLAFLAMGLAGYGQQNDETTIRQILQRQQDAWNRGDLVAFMKGYWPNDSLMYIGKSGITYGYRQTLESYQRNYGDTARMGHFTSTIIHMKRISDDAWFVVGKWYLKRSIGDATGHYTLLFRKLNDEWVIVADHSS